jgi:hypothetical protein
MISQKLMAGGEFPKPKTKNRDNLIKFADFDCYDVQMSEIYEKFGKFSVFTPFADVEEDKDLQIAIEEAISTSENVVRFPNKLPKREEGKE